MDFITDRSMRFIEALGRIETFPKLVAFMDETMALLGIQFYALFQQSNVDIVNVHMIPQIIRTKARRRFKANDSNVRGVHNLPPGWVSRYAEKGYHTANPTMRKAVSTKTAFRWDTLEADGYLQSKRSRIVMQEAAQFGLRDGFICPIIHSNGDTVIVSFAGNRMDDDPRLAPSLKLIALYFHQRFTALQSTNPDEPAPLSSAVENEA